MVVAGNQLTTKGIGGLIEWESSTTLHLPQPLQGGFSVFQNEI